MLNGGLCLLGNFLLLEAEHHIAVEGVEAHLKFRVLLINSLFAKFDDKGEHAVIHLLVIRKF